MTQITDKMIAQNKVERFVSRFQPSYHWLASHAALPLVLTPELVNYLRVQFLKSEGVPWIAEADLLLSELCRPVGYEQYVMDKAVRAYLLDELKENKQFGSERIKQIAELLCNYIKYLSQTNPFISQKELQTQKWGAMLYLKTEETVKEIAEAISNCVDKFELARLLKITEDFKQEIAKLGEFDSFFEYAQLSNDLLRKPETVKPEQIKRSYQVAKANLTLPKTVTKSASILVLETFEFEAEVAIIIGEEDIINYNHLEKLLINRQWKEADKETAKIILKASNQEKRGWLDEIDLQKLPSDVLQILDRLWVQFSQGHFGFSVQKQIWLSVGCQPGQESEQLYQRFGQIVGWYDSKIKRWLMWDEYTFSLEAPVGHLPRYLPSQQTRIRPVLFARPDLLAGIDLSSQSIDNFSFETPTINCDGQIIKTTTHTVSYFTERLTDNVILEMVAIPGGTFTMGSPENESGYDDERPQHNVTLSPFLMGKYPITQAQWKAIASRTDLKVNIDLDEDPSDFKDPYQKDQETIERWLRPVENINWYEAVEFCQRLSKLTGRDYQLPSEAQWEYACRAATEPLDPEKGESYPPFYFGETITGELANYDAFMTYADEPSGEQSQETTPVGQFPPNAFGLYDMHGNVWEWCADDWHDNYQRAPNDGSAWMEFETSYLAKNKQNDSQSVLRGGSWIDDPNNCRSAYRKYISRREDRIIDNGFRVVYVFERTK